MLKKIRKFQQKWQTPVLVEGQLTRWNWMVQGVKNFSLGKNVDIGAFTYINASHNVILEDDVQIGSHCSIYSESTIDGAVGEVIIKKEARIGSHSTIMPGVTVGVGAVVGAHSFVKNNIPAHSLAVGVPAKVVKKII